MSDSLLNRVDALLLEATPGPWICRKNSMSHIWWILALRAAGSRNVAEILGERNKPDADLIAEGINALPLLLRAVKALQAVAEFRHGEHDEDCGTYDAPAVACYCGMSAALAVLAELEAQG